MGAEIQSPPGARRFSLAERLLLVTAGLGILHHVDHVLRYDHSGWPFKPDVTPFTFSLLIYPILGAALLLRSRPWLRVALVAFAFVALQAAHTIVETPRDQYHTWAAGVSDAAFAGGHPNLLHVTSPALGIVAAGLSIVLSLAALATLVALIAEARGAARLSRR